MKKRISILLAVLLVAATLLSACGGGGGASKDSKGDGANALAVCIGPDPETIDPALNSAVDGASMIIHGFETLVTIGKDGEIVPGQAESYTTSDDGLVWTFKLREDLKWSDGTPLTAEDFVYSWKRGVDPATAAPYAELFNVIKGYEEAAEGNLDALGVKAVDDTTFEVTLAQASPYFIQLAAFPTYSPVKKETIEENGETWATKPETYIGNGAFNVTEWVPGEYILFEKNPNYWNADTVKLDSIKFVLMEDPNAVLSAYEKGDILCAKDVPAQEIPKLREREDWHLDDLLGTYYISFMTQKAPFDNPKVRKALSLAIDREHIANVVMQGTYGPASNFVGHGLLDADGKTHFVDNSPEFIDITKHDENLEEAKNLLAEAGYPNGEGLETLEYLTNDASYHRPVAEALQQMWGELGIKLEINVVEWSVFTPTRRNGDYQIARNGWICDYNDPSSMLDLLASTNGNNDGQYSNPEFDEQMEIARTSSDQNVRFEAMHKAEQIAMDDAAIAPVAYYKDFYLLSDKVEGFFHLPLGYFNFINASVK